MKESPDISRVAALIGDPGRANMLTALMDGRALTASELACQAGISKQTASAHLGKLLDGGLLAREIQGRHHYFRLHGPEVAGAIEALMGVAQKQSGNRLRTGPRDPALRKARVCYDHLAGEMGVFLYDSLMEKEWLALADEDLSITAAGRDAFIRFGIDVQALSARRRAMTRSCLDWSMRRHHLGGGLGQALLDGIRARGWAERVNGTRVMRFSQAGERSFERWLKTG